MKHRFGVTTLALLAAASMTASLVPVQAENRNTAEETLSAEPESLEETESAEETEPAEEMGSQEGTEPLAETVPEEETILPEEAEEEDGLQYELTWDWEDESPFPVLVQTVKDEEGRPLRESRYELLAIEKRGILPAAEETRWIYEPEGGVTVVKRQDQHAQVEGWPVVVSRESYDEEGRLLEKEEYSASQILHAKKSFSYQKEEGGVRQEVRFFLAEEEEEVTAEAGETVSEEPAEAGEEVPEEAETPEAGEELPEEAETPEAGEEVPEEPGTPEAGENEPPALAEGEMPVNPREAAEARYRNAETRVVEDEEKNQLRIEITTEDMTRITIQANYEEDHRLLGVDWIEGDVQAENYYNEEGLLTRADIQTTSSHTLKTFTYDLENRTVVIQSDIQAFTSNAKESGTMKYELDELGRILREEKLDQEGKTLDVRHYEYGENGRRYFVEGEIRGLIESYLEAIKNGDPEALAALLDNAEGLDEGNLKKRAEYLEECRDPKYLIYDGAAAGEKVVFVTYQVKYRNIQTEATALEYYYVQRQEDGRCLIVTAPDGETRSHIARIQKEPEVQELIKRSGEALDAAMEADPELKELIDVLNGRAPETLPEGETAESESGETTGAEETPEASGETVTEPEETTEEPGETPVETEELPEETTEAFEETETQPEETPEETGETTEEPGSTPEESGEDTETSRAPEETGKEPAGLEEGTEGKTTAAENGGQTGTDEPAAEDTLYAAEVAERVRVRASMDTSGYDNILGTLEAGEIVLFEGTEGDWSRIEYNGETAYVSTEFLKPLKIPGIPEGEAKDGWTAAEQMTVTERIRVRATMDTSGEDNILGYLNGEESVIRIGTQEDWSLVLYRGTLGYVKTEFLK